MSARAYMDDVERRGLAKVPQLWKDGLNWFFRTGRQHCSASPASVAPRPGQADTGAEPWERRLIERLRAHRDRLRGLHEEDRAAGLAGVWLPEALERGNARHDLLSQVRILH